MTAIKNLAWRTARAVSQNLGVVSDVIYKAAQVYVKAYKNVNYDMSKNGEFFVIDKLSELKIETVFDVGANKGNYTKACLAKLPSATVHAFEIVPTTFEKLSSNVSSARVRLQNVGLSDTDGTVEISYNPDDDGSSSLLGGQNIHGGTWKKIAVKTITGDKYCELNDVDRIDLLKVDVEGVEHLVFKGFVEKFRNQKISAVQFEFGMVNIFSKFLLYDFWKLLTGYGFVLGPLMPRGVVFKDYRPQDEDFQGPPNFFAVRQDKREMIDALSFRR